MVATDEEADRSLMLVDLIVGSLSQTFDLVGSVTTSHEFRLLMTEISMLHSGRGKRLKHDSDTTHQIIE